MLLAVLSSVLLIIILRIFYVIQFKKTKKNLKKKAKTMIVIGSGGHTLEMLKQVRALNPTLYVPRLYVMADTDKSSECKVQEVETELEKTPNTNSKIVKIPRSRTVNQPYFNSIFTTIYSILFSIPVVVSFKPDLILCNGPGTCIPICVIGLLVKIFLFFPTKIVFIESMCRVKTLSLSGKILLYIADLVIVQWPELHKKYPQTVYLGRLA